MFSFAGLDVDVAAAVFAKHNDYIVDYCSVAPDRLVGIGCLPIPDVDAAAGRDGARRPTRRARASWCPAHVDPAPARTTTRTTTASGPPCRTAGAPLTMHIFTGTDWLTGLAEHWGAPGHDDQGLHARPHLGGQHPDRPDLRRRVRALPRPARRRVGVRDRLGVALPAAPRSRHLPHAEARRRLPDDEAERLLPPQRVRHVRGRHRRHRHAPLDRRRQPAAGGTTTRTTTRSGRTR